MISSLYLPGGRKDDEVAGAYDVNLGGIPGAGDPLQTHYSTFHHHMPRDAYTQPQYTSHPFEVDGGFCVAMDKDVSGTKEEDTYMYSTTGQRSFQPDFAAAPASSTFPCSLSFSTQTVPQSASHPSPMDLSGEQQQSRRQGGRSDGGRPSPLGLPDTDEDTDTAAGSVEGPILEVLGKSIPIPKNYTAPKKPRKQPVASVKWTAEEDERLREVVAAQGAKNWRRVAEILDCPGRTDVSCQHRWNKVLRPGLKRGAWTEEEDAVVKKMVMATGLEEIRWSVVADACPGRMGKQCRERWFNHLDPDINRAEWSPEEDRILYETHLVFGNRWTEIAKFVPGRTENAVKNR